MAAMDASGGITPSFNHTSQVLFRPFTFRKWLALAFVSLLAGSAGNSGTGGNFPNPQDMGDIPGDAWAWIVQFWPFLVLGGVILIGLSLLLVWLASVMNFVYIDQIIRNSAAIREPFARLRRRGTSYFLWNLAFTLVALFALALIIGAPLVLVFLVIPDADTSLQVLAVVWAVLVGIPLLIAMSVIDIFTRDFVLPAMYVRGIGVLDGWRMIIPILKENAGQSLLYLLILIGISIVSGMLAIFALLVVLVVFLLPAALLALIGYAIWQIGLVWTVVYGAIVGIPLLLAFILAMQIVLQPVIVFRRTYSLVVIGKAEPSLETVPTA